MMSVSFGPKTKFEANAICVWFSFILEHVPVPNTACCDFYPFFVNEKNKQCYKLGQKLPKLIGHVVLDCPYQQCGMIPLILPWYGCLLL